MVVEVGNMGPLSVDDQGILNVELPSLPDGLDWIGSILLIAYLTDS